MGSARKHEEDALLEEEAMLEADVEERNLLLRDLHPLEQVRETDDERKTATHATVCTDVQRKRCRPG